MSRVATATISTDALKHNLSVVRRLAPESKILAVIKANAYGHGMLTVATALQDADAFAVAHVEGAEALREQFPDKPIVLLQGFTEKTELALLFSQRIDSVIHSLYQVSLLETLILSEEFSPPKKFKVWLKIQTGMNRLGLSIEDFSEAWLRLSQIPQLKNNIRLMSHFANADDLKNESTQTQIDLFNQITATFKVEKSLANSAGIMAWPSCHHQWVRPGIMLYGVSPFINKQGKDFELKPVMTFKSSVIAINHLKKSQTVGYGSHWQANEDALIAVVACGYGDGYPRHIADKTMVLINGQRYPIVGTVSMDMMCVNLGPLNAAGSQVVKVGNRVTLWGEGLPVEQVAEKAGTIAYELLCQVTSRVQFES